MKITIDFDGIEIGRDYSFNFSVLTDGKVVQTSKHNDKKIIGPNLEDFEPEKTDKPMLGEPNLDDFVGKKTKQISDFKVESSFGDEKIGER
jgi:hypothetical protein